MKYDRVDIFHRDEFTCQHCGDPVTLTGKQAQIAHLIPNTISAKKRYGGDVIDHPLNVVLTCSLRCNNAVQLSNNPEACAIIARKVKNEEAGI